MLSYQINYTFLRPPMDSALGDRLVRLNGSAGPDNDLQSASYFCQKKGILQGDSLSPLLFLTFINDSVKHIYSNNTLLYADDMAIMDDTAANLTNSLTLLEEWCKSNKMKINTKKCKILKFRKGGRLQKEDTFTINSEDLEIVNSFSYLGISLQTKLGFTEHIKQRKSIASANIYRLKNLHRLSLPTAMKIFNLKIKPIISYGL